MGLKFALLLTLVVAPLVSCTNGANSDLSDFIGSEAFPPADSVGTTPLNISTSNISAVWANEGGDKVTQEDLRASQGELVTNNIFNGSRINIFGARNEIVSFNLILEAQTNSASNVTIEFNSLKNNSGFEIKSDPSNVDPFNYIGRSIEVFFIRYLQIKGKSTFMCLNYDERHLPTRWQRPHTDGTVTAGGWTDRPDHDAHYPDIAVPIELENNFTISQGKNQSIWADIYIPKNTPTGIYRGEVKINENTTNTWVIPVSLFVFNFSLPDEPTAKTMINLGYGDINQRYLGTAFPNDATAEFERSRIIRDRHFQMAHRHKLSLIDANNGTQVGEDADTPNHQWQDRLTGQLFTRTKNYDGPGVGVGNGIFSVGTYGSWSFIGQSQATFWQRSNDIVDWFKTNAANTDYFLYLIDESSNYAQIQLWGTWAKANPGSGKALKTMATVALPDAWASMPALDIPTSTMYVGDTTLWQNALANYLNKTDKRFFMYNSGRPAVGSFMTEDDGTALRMLPWAQYKKGIHRWFYWESTYYKNAQGDNTDTDVFNTAKTFGLTQSVDAELGQTGSLYSNGDGVLFYPGTDTIFPASSYNIDGPIASLRLKHWRRGVQDSDYLALARQKNTTKMLAVLNRMVPQVVWEYGIDNPSDPTYKRTAISWSDDPYDWEEARWELAKIIQGQ